MKHSRLPSRDAAALRAQLESLKEKINEKSLINEYVTNVSDFCRSEFDVSPEYWTFYPCIKKYMPTIHAGSASTKYKQAARLICSLELTIFMSP